MAAEALMGGGGAGENNYHFECQAVAVFTPGLIFVLMNDCINCSGKE
jgi:hypothetical protein